MLKRIGAIVAALTAVLIALGAGPATAAPTEVQMGACRLRLNNVSQKDGGFDVVMWVWFRWQDKDIKPWETIEVADGAITGRSEAAVTEDQG